jgi:hypothetical protein
MVFTTAFSKNMLEQVRRWLMLLVCLPVLAWAAEIEVIDPQITATDDGYVLSADFKFELNQRLEDAVSKGLMLHFVADFELNRGRWYWFDEKVVTRSQDYRLSYHALTRQYRVSTGGLHQSFASLNEALAMLSRLRGWLVVDKGDLLVRPGEPYQAAIRLRLDITQLPRPFQITSLGNKDWNLASDRKAWLVSLPPLPVETK